MESSPYDVLRVGEDADADEIERAYRERVKETHPDHGGSVEAFRRVRRAYERLTTGPPEVGAGDTDGDGADRESRRRRDPDASTASSTGSARGRRAPGSRARTAGGRGAREGGGDRIRDRERATPTRVTYLDYDVLSEFDWSVDDDPFARAAETDLEPPAYGQFWARPGESLLEAAERRGYAWPFACRGGACANCAVMVLEGDLSMPVSHVLTEDLMRQRFRLSCNAVPVGDELKVVYNVKHVPELEDLLLPSRRFERAHGDD